MPANKRYVHAYETIDRICKNVLRMQHQAETCTLDLGDGSHIFTCAVTKFQHLSDIVRQSTRADMLCKEDLVCP